MTQIYVISLKPVHGARLQKAGKMVGQGKGDLGGTAGYSPDIIL
jgi:hypothetical protein